MKYYSPLTLLASSVLSFGLQAAVVATDSNDHYQVSESVSSVLYKSQRTTVLKATEAPSTENKYATDAAVISVVKKPQVIQSEKMPASADIQLVDSNPTIAGGANKAPLILPLPAKITPVSPVTVSSPVRVNPPLPLAVFSEPAVKPSLFSAISDWFSVKPVKPWQKGTLAKKSMKPGGEVPEFDFFSEKVFAYKQGSIGGNGVGGGGCGCN